MSTIEERVKQIVVEQLGVGEDEVKDESSFVDDLGADSLDTVELVMALEEEFECEIPDERSGKRLQQLNKRLITYTRTNNLINYPIYHQNHENISLCPQEE